MTVLERPPVDWERHRGDKRPKILPPPGETWRNPGTNRKVGHRYYTRVTTFADAITEAYNLTAWKLRRALLGAGQRADYVALAASYTDSDRDRDALDELVGKVLEAAGPNKADLGTALHGLTERVDRGEDLGNPPESVLPDLAAYTALVEGVLEMLLREPRTVCDELECAGTPDTIARVAEAPPTDWGPSCDCPADRPRIVDTKTGSIRYPGKMSTQLAIYSRSALYNPETGERTPLDVCPHWGVIVHLPVETGEAALYWLDLEHGWRGAQLCGPVRAWHRIKTDDVIRPFATIKPVKVVDGEVTRIEPRLASVGRAQPEAIVDITAALEASNQHVQQLKREAADAQDRAEAAEERLERDDEGDEAALHEDLAECDVRVVGRNDDGSPMHWCAVHDGAWPHEPPLATRDEVLADLEASRRPGLPIAPGPDTCAHSGGLTIPARGGGLVCRDCGEPGGFGPSRSPVTEAATVDPLEVDQRLADEAALHAEVEQLVETGVVDPAVADEFEAQVAEDLEQLASGPDSDAEDEPEPVADPDPLGSEIKGCVTVRELELLGTTRWREWTEAHRALAVEVHERLDHAERVEAPRAAAEAAILSAASLDQLGAVMTEIGEAEWMTNDLFTLADAQWRQLKRDAGRVTA